LGESLILKEKTEEPPLLKVPRVPRVPRRKSRFLQTDGEGES
jgi:hypothetical protein